MIKPRIVIALCSVALCAACAGRGAIDSAQPAIAVPEAWQAGEPGEPLDVERYWDALGDPLLSSFVAQAAAQNRDLAVATARLAQARGGLRQARAGAGQSGPPAS